MPRLYRDSPLNSIWEGSGNVAALDVLRAMAKEPEGLPAFLAECELARRRRRAPRRPRRARQGAGRRAGRRRTIRSSAPAAWSRTWRWRCRARCSCATRPPAVADAFCAAPARRRRPRLRHAAGRRRRRADRRARPGRRSGRDRSPTRSTGASRGSRSTGPSAATASRSTCRASWRECVERGQPRPGGARDRAHRRRQGLLRRLRPGRVGRADMRPRGDRTDRLAARPRWSRQPRPAGTWDPVVDWQMMSRNLRGFMSLFHSDKPIVCKVHGFCVAGGTDMALCSRPARDRRRRAHRLPARARLGRADLDAVGAPDRPRARQAAAVHRRPARRARGRGVGPGDRVATRPTSSTSASRSWCSGSR